MNGNLTINWHSVKYKRKRKSLGCQKEVYSIPDNKLIPLKFLFTYKWEDGKVYRKARCSLRVDLIKKDIH